MLTFNNQLILETVVIEDYDSLNVVLSGALKLQVMDCGSKEG